jgi:hypothetical protein
MQSSAKRVVALAFLGVAIASSASPVIVREGVNAFVIGGDGAKAPLPINSIVEPGASIRTDVGGRVQLEIGNSLVRLGADSSLTLTKEGHITLDRGAFLLKDIPHTDDVICRTGGKEVRISGSYGFVNLEGASEKAILLIGALAGDLTVRTGSTKDRLNPADVLVGSGEKFHKSLFDLSKMIKTSRLINGFTRPLGRDQALVTAERDFKALQRRGFVRTPNVDQMALESVSPNSLLVTRDRQVPEFQNGASAASPLAHSLASTPLQVLAREGLLDISLDARIIGIRVGAGNGLGPDTTPNGNSPPHNPNGDPHIKPPGNSGNAPGHGK